MKRLLALLLSFCLVMMACSAMAEVVEESDVTTIKKLDVGQGDESVMREFDPGTLALPEQPAEDAEGSDVLSIKKLGVGQGDESVMREFDPGTLTPPERPDMSELDVEKSVPTEEVTKAVTSDLVTINGNSCIVTLSCGMTFNYSSAPSGVYILTQDLVKQSALYNQVYKNPKETVDNFIAKGMHLNIFDPNNKLDIYLFVYSTDLSNVYLNTGSMSNEELKYVTNYMFTDPNYLQDCSEAQFGWMGGNVWILGDARTNSGLVKMCAFVGGLEIWGFANATTDSQYNRVIDLMENLTIR